MICDTAEIVIGRARVVGYLGVAYTSLVGGRRKDEQKP